MKRNTERGTITATMLGGPMDGGTILVSEMEAANIDFGIGIRSESGNGWIHHYSRVPQSSEFAPVYMHSMIYRDAHT